MKGKFWLGLLKYVLLLVCLPSLKVADVGHLPNSPLVAAQNFEYKISSEPAVRLAAGENPLTRSSRAQTSSTSRSKVSAATSASYPALSRPVSRGLNDYAARVAGAELLIRRPLHCAQERPAGSRAARELLQGRAPRWRRCLAYDVEHVRLERLLLAQCLVLLAAF